MSPGKATGRIPPNKRWTSGKIQSLRQELLNGATLVEVAKREGVTHQRISKLVGPIRPRT